MHLPNPSCRKDRMSNVRVLQMPTFKRAYKKLHRNQKAAVDKAVAVVVSDPSSGEEKKGDLAGIFVYKFDCINRQFLLAYEFDPATRLLHAVGVHENFYKNLKSIPTKSSPAHNPSGTPSSNHNM